MKVKILLVLTFILIIFDTSAQDTSNNFVAENNFVFWQKVFETDLTEIELITLVKESGFLENYQIEENKIYGNLKPIDADFKGAGFSEMVCPMYIARSFFDGFVIIEFKENRYRVTLKNIMLTQKYDDGLSKEGERTTLETFALKNGQNVMKSAFVKNPSFILNFTFSNIFNFTKLAEDDKW